MEALSLSPRRLSREEIFAGVGGSILGHALILGAALLLPAMMPRSTTPLVFATVNLVSMDELGGGGTVSPQGGKSRKREGVKEVKSSEGSAPSQRSRPFSPVVPVKRLRMEDSAPREHSIKKLDAPQIAGAPENRQASTSIEKDLDKLIPKAKPSTQGSSSSGADTDKKTSARDHAAEEDRSGGTDRGKEKGASASSGGASGGIGSEGSGGNREGGQVALARRLYYTEIWNAIRQQWTLPESLKSQKLEAVLVVVVRRDGKILDIRFERKSGQPLFDESAMRAVRKADPLPPFPEIYSPLQEEIGLRFRPEDLA
ncbi:MAG: TonB C-terminal domain-containing protein [Syntrophobacteraceae bacterium]|nr:TonB C-terminal domain-containing protein [Syntrophobacteraceae bacterium]